jgi:hypothetical protein
MAMKSSVRTFCVTGFALLLAWAKPIYALDLCEAQYLNDREAKLRIGSSNINIIGWEHLDDRSGEYLVEGMKIVFESAKTGKCSEAISRANSILNDLTTDFQNAKWVFDRLSFLNGELPLANIGVEMTPAELQSQWQLNIRINEVFTELQNLCDPALQGLLASLRMMLPGPEFEFHRLHENISIEALEDQAAKDANENDFAGEELDTFDYANPAMTSQAQMAIDSIRQSIMKQRFPSESLIQAAVAFEKNSASRSKLEAELRYSITKGMRIIKGAYKRNINIATKLLRLQGNIALPIGFRHVDHLVDEILRQCRAK